MLLISDAKVAASSRRARRGTAETNLVRDEVITLFLVAVTHLMMVLVPRATVTVSGFDGGGRFAQLFEFVRLGPLSPSHHCSPAR
jgi:hypothetical protein